MNQYHWTSKTSREQQMDDTPVTQCYQRRPPDNTLLIQWYHNGNETRWYVVHSMLSDGTGRYVVHSMLSQWDQKIHYRLNGIERDMVYVGLKIWQKRNLWQQEWYLIVWMLCIYFVNDNMCAFFRWSLWWWWVAAVEVEFFIALCTIFFAW